MLVGDVGELWRVVMANAYDVNWKWEKVRGAKRMSKEGGWSGVCEWGRPEGFEFDFFAGGTRHSERVRILDI